MRHKLFLLTIIILLSTCTGLSQWVSFTKNSQPGSEPVIQLIRDDDKGTIIKVDISGFSINEFQLEGKIFHSIDLGALGSFAEAGMPDVPYISKILAIPDQGSITAEVIEISKTRIIKGINIPPVKESWSEGQPETPYIVANDIYCSDKLYPATWLKVEDPAVFRDFRIARVCIYPIRYSPAKKEIEAVSSVTIRLKYGGGTGVNPKLLPDRPIAPSYAKLYKSIIFNYDEVLQRRYNGRVGGYDLMLCIMPDSFATSFQTYADWNHKTGTFIHITKFSEIGASGTNPTAVKNHILDAYSSWPIPPTHVLLVGDAGVAPISYYSAHGYTFTNDDYFVELTGSDYFPEMMIGRFTNQSNSRMRVIINKDIGYEKNPYIADPTWFRKGLVCANNAYPTQILTKKFAKQEMLQHGNFISVDSLYNGSPCPGNIEDIINMINEGRGWLNYRGEGWYTYWWASCFQLSASDILNLNNGRKLTFVTSIGCGVANFNEGSNNNFGETWMKIGTETSPRGACAFVGPVSNTHTYYNDEIDKGIYIGMFEEGLESPGEALLRGKFRMYEVFGGLDDYVEYHFRIYHVLGDPSLHIWKDTPRNVIVNYTGSIPIGPSAVQVSVIDAATSEPISDALVCISANDTYVDAFTLANGTATINVNTQSIELLNITVSGKNIIPFEGTIQVSDIQTFPLSVYIANGWNLVSVPGINSEGQGIYHWWSHLTGSVFRFIPGTGYSEITTTTPGQGYWMKNNGENIYNTGDEWPSGGIQIATHSPINLSQSWNIFGGFEDIVDAGSLNTTPPEQILFPIYKYVPGTGYQPATQIIPGYGYWIKMQSACQLNIPNVSMVVSNKDSEYLKDYLPENKTGWGKLIFTDANGKSYTLYTADNNSDLSKYELPPLPPYGVFDIRFGSGRIAEDLSSSQSVLLSGIEYPLKVRSENISVLIKDETGKVLNELINPGEETIIGYQGLNKLIVCEEQLPSKYVLEQNYPNPFNSTTNIKYSIPADGFINISVYNILGEKLAEIINGEQKAGSYNLRFNSDGISSGIYLCKMQSADNCIVKKMIILK